MKVNKSELLRIKYSLDYISMAYRSMVDQTEFTLF